MSAVKAEYTFDNAVDAQIEITAIREELTALQATRTANSLEAVLMSRSAHQANKKALKSDVKKTGAFVKRMRVITSDGLQQCVRETESLNLNLYISEIVGAVVETTYKATDVAALARLCEALHRRYEDFSDSLLSGIKTALLAAPAEDDKEVPKRRRLQIRLLLELFQLGVFVEDAFFLRVVRMLLGTANRGAATAAAATADAAPVAAINKKLADLQGLVTFVKFGHELILGYPTTRQLAAATAASGGAVDVAGVSVASLAAQKVPNLPVSLFATERTCEVARTLVLAAFEQLAGDLTGAHKDLRTKEKRFEKERLLHGSLTEAKQTTLDAAQRFFERLLPVVQSLSECLYQEMPEMPEEQEETASSSKGIRCVCVCVWE